MADVVIINKADSATPDQLAQVQASVESVIRPGIPVVLSDSAITAAGVTQIRAKKVLVVGDGPTLTHGGMAYGASTVVANKMEAAEIVSGRKFAVGAIAAAYDAYPHLETEVPALGYNPEQLADLEATLNAADADIILYATPVNLGQLITANKPMVAVGYEMEERGGELETILADFDYFKLAGG
jgi:predicted GTPase